MSYPNRYVNSPLEVAGCSVWLDASDLATITKDGSNKVSAWADKSGNARNVTQANGTKQPTYQATGGPSNQAALSFDGVDDQLAFASSLSFPAGCSLFAVLSSTSNALRHTIFACKEWAVYASSAVGGQWNFFSNVDSPGAGRLADTGPHIISSVNTATLLELMLDGSMNQKVPLTGGQARASNSSIGTDPNTTSHPANMRLSEIIVYDHAVTAGERAQIEQYLAQKWNTGPRNVIGAPTDLSGCALWLDGLDAASITQDGSNKVSQWSDKSGLGNHATQATPGDQPTYSATGFGGLPCLDWGNGEVASRRLVTPNLTYGLFTIFIVGRGIVGTTGYTYVHNTYNGTDSEYVLHGGAAARPQILLARAGVVNSRDVDVFADGARHIVTRFFGGSNFNHSVRTDGLQAEVVNRTTGNPGTATTTGPVYVGNANLAVAPHKGVIAEFIVFDRMLTEGEMVAVEQYLSKKWSIAPRRAIASPLEIAGCLLWLDATDLSSITKDGSNLVSQWSDKSGLANHATQATPANQPTYSAVGYNGLPCLDWGASPPAAMGLNTQAISYGTFTAFFVIDGIAGGGYLCGHVNAGNNQDYVYKQTASFFVARAAVLSGKNVFGGTGWIAGKKILTRRFDGLNATNVARGNGVLFEQSSVVGGSSDPGTAAVSAVIGIGNSGTGAESWRGKIGEVVIYSRRLADGELAQVEAYLQKKWTVGPWRLIASPLELTGCVAWHDASQGVTLDGSSKVSQWNDLSGLAHHLTQANTAKRPAVNPSAINGSPAILFDGVDDFLQAVFTLTTERTLFLIYKSVTIGASTVHDVIADGGTALGMSVLSDTTPQLLLFSGVAMPARGAFASGRYAVLSATFSTTKAASRVDGVVLARGSSGGNPGGGLTLGAFADGTRSTNIEVAEAVLFDRALTEGEIALMERYFVKKHAL